MSDRLKSFTESLLDDLDSSDGSFKLENQNARAILKVYPPGKKGRPVALNDVLARIELFSIEEVDLELVKEVVDQADGEEHHIGQWKTNHPEDAQVELRVSKDLMKAFLKLTPPKFGGSVPNYQKLLTYIQEEGIKFGIDENVLRDMARNPSYHDEYIVATGKEPLHSTNGYIRTLFESNQKPRPKDLGQGRVDLRELGLIVSVEKDSVIAEKVAPVKGEYGQNVLGEMIPFNEGKDAEWYLGYNVRLSEDGLKLLANITGRPMVDRFGEIRVDEIVNLENIDYSTGNVDFPGTIIVQNTVADGFRLTTKGSIIVKRTVGKVFLKAEGDIELTEGFVGRGEGLIESQSNIYVRFVEQGKIISKGSIFIQDASMHSELIAHDSIILTGGKGELIGGEALAGENIICSGIGARVETKTRLMVGTPPDLVSQLEKLKEEIFKQTETLKKVQASLVKLREIESKQKVDAEEKQMINKLQMAEEKYQGLLESSQKQYEIAISNYQPNPKSYVLAKNEIHPGVEVTLGRGKFFRVTLKPLTGRNYLYLDKNKEVVNTNMVPDFLDDRPAKPA